MDKYNELLQQFQQANQNIEKLNQTLTEKESEIKVVYKFLIQINKDKESILNVKNKLKEKNVLNY